MENATEALQMAFGVLVFVIALSISINAFGEARQSAQIILDNTDREYDYTYVEENNSTKRIVGAETIIPSIYKAYRENYKIVFKKDKDNGMELYRKLVASNSADTISICSIDLEKDVIGSDKQKEKFIQFLLYGYDNIADIKIFTDAGISGLERKGSNETLYSKIQDKKFEETLGVYYQEELQQKQTDVEPPDANKTEKRVITYTIYNN